MTTTLSEGVKVPDVGSVNWAGDLEVNWNLLNGALANLSGNVKLDRDNTWTGEQSFTLPIVGSITGTASKAIADEDGTSIKSGYVNVAGNQTVTGQKTWSGNQFFNTGAYYRNTSYETGNTPVSNVVIPIYFVDKVNANTGYVRNVILTTGKTQSELMARNKFTSGALSPTGTEVTSTLQVEVQPNGTKALYFDGSIRNNVLPYTTNTYSLGSSSYQWSSVYAQTYYYNGTAWGLDKANVWTQTNYFTKDLIINSEVAANTQSALSGSKIRQFIFNDSSNSNYFFRLRQYVDATSSRMQFNAQGFDSNQAYSATFVYRTNSNGNTELYPGDNNQSLGTSTSKWKTLNGVNPGALGIPDKDNMVNIASEFTDLTGGFNYYIPPTDGFVSINADTDVYCAVVSSTHNTAFWRQSAVATSTGYASVTIPVRAGLHLQAKIKSTVAIYAAFYPCLGNV